MNADSSLKIFNDFPSVFWDSECILKYHTLLIAPLALTVIQFTAMIVIY